MKKKTKKAKCVHDDYQIMMDIFVKHTLELEHKVWKRCALEGCRYGYEPMDKEPADKCMYCGEPRNYYFHNMGPIKSIQESLKKVRVKTL